MNLKDIIEEYEKTIIKRKNSVVHFPVVAYDDGIDMSRVYPTKQNAVKNIVNALRLNVYVESLILFGSSITMRCNKDSDLDLAVGINTVSTEVKNEVSEIIQECCNWGADIIWLDSLSDKERLYENIMNGVKLI